MAVDEFRATGRLPGLEQARTDVLAWFFGDNRNRATSHANSRLREMATDAARDRAADLIGKTELHPAVPEPPARRSPKERERRAEVEDQKAVVALAEEARSRLYREDASVADRHESTIAKIVDTLLREPERADFLYRGVLPPGARDHDDASMVRLSDLVLGLLFLPASLAGQRVPSISEFLGDRALNDGFVPFAWSPEDGRLLAEIRPSGDELLWVASVASGLGSNPVGLDRGSIGPREVVVFRRVGPRVFLVAKNLRYRALSEDARERLSVDESFADSILQGFDVLAQSDDRVVIDLAPFLLQDAVGAASRVKSQDGVDYGLDDGRSTVEPASCKAFPDNTELEVSLTFATSERSGAEVTRTAATGKAFTIRQRHSFVRLPEPMQPRMSDIRVGFFGESFRDYAVPLDEDLDQRFIARHRLELNDRGQIEEPIVYYVDSGAPEPVRSALVEGASWWGEAFEAAGFPDGFSVEVLPEGIDPLDLRYNVIHWVHRATRGWSYGASVTDPRTGEILKGSVLLGSLRVRQDLLMFGGLGIPGEGDAACAASVGPDAAHLLAPEDATRQDLALARIRQLAAHEVGHTLGLSHNFAASAYGRASVMDYPAPWIRRDGNELVVDGAYDTGIGEYDIWAIRYGYTQFPSRAAEEVGLPRILREGLDRGFVFLTDQDARSPGTMHPMANLWDNGSDPVEELRSVLAVQDLALGNLERRFEDGQAVREGQPLANLEASMVPLMLHWRFQATAAAKKLGGVDYRHAVRGDGQRRPVRIGREEQLEALEALLSILSPARLTPPPGLRDRIPPPPPGDPSAIERFDRSAGAFLHNEDFAQAGVTLLLDLLLHPRRIARCQQQPDGPDLGEILDRLSDRAVFGSDAADSAEKQVQRLIATLTVDRLARLARSSSLPASAHVELRAALSRIHARLERTERSHEEQRYFAALAAHAERAAKAPLPDPAQPPAESPPGQPIGN